MDWKKCFTSYQDAFINDLRGLLAIDSTRDDSSATANAPFGKGCRQALDYMFALAKRDGFMYQDYDGYAGVICYGDGEESVGVLAHLDIVPIGEGWSKDPFGGEIVDGYLFGRGSEDDKGPAMAAYYAMKMLKDQGIQLQRKVMLILGCDEESGMQCMEHYKKHGEIPTLGFTPDADFPVIYGEKGGLHVDLLGEIDNSVIEEIHAGEALNIVIGKADMQVHNWKEEYATLFDFYLQCYDLKGEVTYENSHATLHIEGKAAHAMEPYMGVNAALHLFNFVGTAMGDTFAKKTYQLLANWQGKELGILIDGADMGFLTMNLGKVDIENGKAKLQLDIRYPNDADVHTMRKAIEEACQGYELTPHVYNKANPLFVDPNSELVQTLTSVYQAYSNDYETKNMTIGGGTYAKKFEHFVAYGPLFPKQDKPKGLVVGGCHQADEGIALSDLFTATAIYTEAIAHLAGGNQYENA